MLAAEVKNYCVPVASGLSVWHRRAAREEDVGGRVSSEARLGEVLLVSAMVLSDMARSDRRNSNDTSYEAPARNGGSKLKGSTQLPREARSSKRNTRFEGRSTVEELSSR